MIGKSETLQRRHALVVVLGFFLFIAFLLIYWRFGFLYLDAGYYVSAARQVSEGNMPYRDCFFPQGPVYPYIYGFFHTFLGSTVQSSRGISLFLASFTWLLCVYGAFRLGGFYTSLLVMTMLCCNSFIAYNLVIEKLHALSALFYSAGCLLILLKRRTSGDLMGLFLLTLGACTRYTLMPGLFIITLGLLWLHRKNFMVILGVFCVVCLTGLFISAPFLLICPEQFLYGIIGVHISAEAGTVHHFGIVGKLGALSELVRTVPLLIGLTLFVFGIFVAGKQSRQVFRGRRELYVILSLGLISLAHLSANWFHASYQIIIIPVWSVMVSLYLTRFLGILNRAFLNRTVLVTCVAISILTGVSQGRSFIWFSAEGVASPFLEDIAPVIDQYTSKNDRILTDQPLIAHQANRKLEKGFEGAPFTYTPFWDRKQCEMFSTINDDMLAALIENRSVPLLALTPESFRMASPGFVMINEERFQKTWELINTHYTCVHTFPSFAGTENPLHLFVPRTDERSHSRTIVLSDADDRIF